MQCCTAVTLPLNNFEIRNGGYGDRQTERSRGPSLLDTSSSVALMLQEQIDVAAAAAAGIAAAKPKLYQAVLLSTLGTTATAKEEYVWESMGVYDDGDLVEVS